MIHSSLLFAVLNELRRRWEAIEADERYAEARGRAELDRLIAAR